MTQVYPLVSVRDGLVLLPVLYYRILGSRSPFPVTMALPRGLYGL